MQIPIVLAYHCAPVFGIGVKTARLACTRHPSITYFSAIGRYVILFGGVIPYPGPHFYRS